MNVELPALHMQNNVEIWNQIFWLAQLDEQHLITSMNDLFKASVGDHADTMSGKPLELFFQPFSLKTKRIISWRSIWESIEQEGQWDGYVFYASPDNSRLTLFVTIKPYESESKTVYYFIAQDRTRQAAEFVEDLSKLRDLAFLKEAFDEASIIAITDNKGVITYVNDKFCKISKYDRSELIGRTHRIINSKHHPKHFFADMWNTIQQGKVWRGEVKNRAKDGSYYWMNTTIVPFVDEDRKPYQYVSIRSDITDRVKAETKLAEAMQHDFRRTIKSLQNCIYKVKRNELGEVVFTLSEGKIAEKLSITTEQVEGKTLREVWKADFEQVERYYEQAFAGTGSQFEMHYEGSYFFVSLSPVVNQGKVHEVVASMVEITERKKAEELIHYMAHYDALTNLPNRTLFTSKLKHAIARAEQEYYQIAVLFIDLDRFKTVNDTMGHSKGDELLRQVARRLQTSLPTHGYASRQGGDEFTLFLDYADRSQAAELALSIIDQLSAPFVLDEVEVYVTPSIGISMYPDDGLAIEQLLKCADAAMYHAKEGRKSNFCFFSEELHQKITNRLELERDLRRAVGQGELELWYQPKMNLSSSRLIGMEALLRWKHPVYGIIAPGQFIHIAEETNLITPIGEWVLKEACRQMKVWLEHGMEGLSVAVNISFRQFADHEFPELVAKALHEAGLPPQYLELEITESVAQNAMHAISALTKIKELGVGVSIDDFGTGYSSLSYLSQFPIDRLKIDQSFVRNLNASNQAIIRSILDIANHMNITVIAEGVETLEQVHFLQQHRCQEAQGYYYSKPLPAEQAFEYMVKHSGKT